MMLNPMPAGQPELQWTEFERSDFTDLEWTVKDMEFLGVKNRYLMIRGTNSHSYPTSLTIPGDIKITTPYNRAGFVLQYWNDDGTFEFLDADVIDADSNTVIKIPANRLSRFGDCRFFVMAKTVEDGV